ncbi:hypothetical protein FWD07_01560 [Candidatus Saccharibacteria bacterium]|nr:hypothetical protein [Candidatus Saccharibacteria bacterium]
MRWIEENRKESDLLNNIKEAHIRRVAGFVCEMGVAEEDAPLAELIAWLHDLAFYVSDDEENHVHNALEIVFDQGLIYDLIPAILPKNEIYKIIRKAIKHHGDLLVDRADMTEREWLHVCIVRDADKLDNLVHVKPGTSIEDLLRHKKGTDGKSLTEADLIHGVVSDEVYSTFMSGSTINYAIVKTACDWWVAWSAYAFDLLLPESKRLVRESRAIRSFMSRGEFSDPKTSTRFAAMIARMDGFLEEQD